MTIKQDFLHRTYMVLLNRALMTDIAIRIKIKVVPPD